MNKNNFLALAVGAMPSCPSGAWPCGNGFYEYDSWRTCMKHFFMWWDWLASNFSYVNVSMIMRALSPQPLALPWFRESDIAEFLVSRIGAGMVRVNIECLCDVFEALQITSCAMYHLRRNEIIEEYMLYREEVK